MWFLPREWIETEAALPPGKYLLPWYYTKEDIDRLLTLFQHILPNTEYVLRLDWTILEQLSSHPFSNLDRSVVLLDIPEYAVDAVAMETLQDCLPARYLLVRIAVRQENGYGWQEKYVKPVLVSLLKRYVENEDNPLRALNIDKLPLFVAAGLTSEPVELLDLVQKTMDHRLRNATVGLDEEDYRRSLDRVAGERLAARLSVLEPHRLQAALEIILSEHSSPTDPKAFESGASALAELGLAVKVGDDLSLGALARRAVDRAMRAAFVGALPKGAWNDTTRQLLKRLDAENEVPNRSELPQLDFPSPPFLTDINDVELPKAFDHAPLFEKASMLVSAVASPFGDRLSDAIVSKTNSVLRELRRAESTASASVSLRFRAWIQALLFLIADGRDRLEKQEAALNALPAAPADEQLDPFKPVFHLALAWSWLNSLQGVEGIRKADAVLFEAQKWMDQNNRDTLLGFVLLTRGRIAGATRKNDEAERYLQEAVKAFEDHADRNDSPFISSSSVKKGLMYAYVELGTLYLDTDDEEQASQWFPKAERLVDDIGTNWDRATVYLHLGRWKQRTGDLDAAKALYERCLPLEEEIGDTPRLAVLYRQLGKAAESERDFEAAARWYMKSLSLAESLDNVAVKALLHMELGGLAEKQDDPDHAVRWYKAALKEYEKLKFTQGQGIALTRLGVVYLSSRVDRAISCLKQSAELFRTLNSTIDERQIRVILAILLHKSNRPREAKSALDRAIQIGGMSPDILELRNDIEHSIRDGGRQ